jgi:hypothetical protein
VAKWGAAYRNLGEGLWEVRSDLHSDRIARLLFYFHEGMLVVLLTGSSASGCECEKRHPIVGWRNVIGN